jgi:hypothetical protein
MRFRARSTAIVTWIVTCVIALAVPTTQLTTFSTKTTCCCPNPANCHCPDHKADHSDKSTIRACHRTSHDSIAPTLPSFVSPAEVAVDMPVAETPVALVALPAPHDEPEPLEPTGPS